MASRPVDPTPAQIKRLIQKIQATWSEATRESRIAEPTMKKKTGVRLPVVRMRDMSQVGDDGDYEDDG